jgi:hypothetical protein
MGRKKKELMKYNDYLNLVMKAEEFDCIKAYDNAKSKKQKFSTAKYAFRRIDGK